MLISTLTAKRPLVKTITREGTEPYPMVKRFTSSTVQVSTIQEFHEVVLSTASAGGALLKGVLSKDITNEPRAGLTDASAPTQWVCLDVDGLDLQPDALLNTIGLYNIAHVVQYSASQGFKPGQRYHIFLLLDSPQTPQFLKDWLKHVNLLHFSDQVELTASGCALRWPLDITTCQSDKLIFVAPPACSAPITDPLTQAERYTLVASHAHAGCVSAHYFTQVMAKEPQATEQQLLSALRAKASLPQRRSYELKHAGQTTYLPKPNTPKVTGERVARGYCYFNFNGGDSWAYYYSLDNPKFVHNFKGEPSYLLSELLPDYTPHIPELDPNNPYQKILVACRDPRTGVYLNGHITGTGEVNLTRASNRTQLIDFMLSQGRPSPEPIQDWTFTYDPRPTAPSTQPSTRFINLYQPPTPTELPSALPSALQGPSWAHISALITNVLGPDPIRSHFLNWLAFILQTRTSTQTAWIAQGVPGTGKGLLFNEILRPALGRSNTSMKRMSELEEKYTDYMENKLLVFIDEIEIGKSKAADRIIADLKNFITEPYITIRRMHQTAYESPNFTNWLMSSNMHEPLKIDQTDRRFNIGDFVHTPLKAHYPDTAQFITQLRRELPAFIAWLSSPNHFKINELQARTVIHTDARQDLIESSKSSVDLVTEYLLAGDLPSLYAFLPTNQLPAHAAPHLQVLAASYRTLLDSLLESRRHPTREDLLHIFQYCCGQDIPDSPAKFSRFCAHRGIKIVPVYNAQTQQTHRGAKITWNIPQEFSPPQQTPSSSTPGAGLRVVA